jgi:hypothetical protein
MANAQAIRAGAAYIELFIKDNRLVSGLQAAQARLVKFAAATQTLGVQLTAVGGLFSAPFLLALDHFKDAGDALNKMAARTGASTNALSELGFAAEQSGASLEVVERSLKKMQKAISDAGEGSQSAATALARVGLRAKDLRNLSPDEQLERIADGLKTIESPSRRAAAAMALFGEEGTALLPLVADGARGIRQLRQEARDLGLSVDPQDAQSAADFGDAWNRVQRAIRSVVFSLGGAIAPVMTEFYNSIKNTIGGLSIWIQENRGLAVSLFQIASAVASAGTALLIISPIVTGFSAAIGGVVAIVKTVGVAIGLVGTILSALLTPIGLVVAGMAGFTAYLLTATEFGAKTLAWLGDAFNSLKETALRAWQGIGDALAAGDIALAAKILWLSLAMEWQRGVNILNQSWQDWKAFFLKVGSEASHNLALVLNDGWAFTQAAWAETVNFMANLWSGFVNVVQHTWRWVSDFVMNRITEVFSLFDDTIDAAAIKAERALATEKFGQQIDTELTDTVRNNTEARDQRRRAIEEQRAGTRDALESNRAIERQQIDAAKASSLQAAEQALAKARGEWEAALNEAARKRGESAEQQQLDQYRLRAFQQQLPDLEDIESATKASVDVIGTFNPAAITRLFAEGGDVEDRQLRQLQDINQNIARIARKTDLGGPQFV